MSLVLAALTGVLLGISIFCLAIIPRELQHAPLLILLSALAGLVARATWSMSKEKESEYVP